MMVVMSAKMMMVQWSVYTHRQTLLLRCWPAVAVAVVVVSVVVALAHLQGTHTAQHTFLHMAPLITPNWIIQTTQTNRENAALGIHEDSSSRQSTENVPPLAHIWQLYTFITLAPFPPCLLSSQSHVVCHCCCCCSASSIGNSIGTTNCPDRHRFCYSILNIVGVINVWSFIFCCGFNFLPLSLIPSISLFHFEYLFCYPIRSDRPSIITTSTNSQSNSFQFLLLLLLQWMSLNQNCQSV